MSAAQSLPELLRTRRTVGAFRPEPVPAAIVDEALELATWAPNHRKTEPWRFTLLGAVARQAIIEQNAALVAAKKGADAGEAKRRQWSAVPGWLIVTQVLRADPFTREEDYAACCCAIQNLMLAFWSHGVGTKWSTGDVTRDPVFAAAAGFDPARERVVGLIWFGYPEVVPQQGRKPTEEVIRRRD